VKPFPNQFYVTAQIASVQAMRFTPAGVPSLNLFLCHESELEELGQIRQVKAEFKAVAFGTIAEQLSLQALGTSFDWVGFIALARSSKQLLFHIQQFSSH
jgi:primosomal replication protein N